mgnify:CR=1 FL=1
MPGPGAASMGKLYLGGNNMKHRSNRPIITNRQLNFTLSPVDTHNPKLMPYKSLKYEIDCEKSDSAKRIKKGKK